MHYEAVRNRWSALIIAISVHEEQREYYDFPSKQFVLRNDKLYIYIYIYIYIISEELSPPSSGLKEFRLVDLIPLTLKME